MCSGQKNCNIRVCKCDLAFGNIFKLIINSDGISFISSLNLTLFILKVCFTRNKSHYSVTGRIIGSRRLMFKTLLV